MAGGALSRDPAAESAGETCPLCGSAKRFAKPKKRKRLYGHLVCKKCYYSFANRRQLAYAIDVFLGWFFANFCAGVVVGIIGGYGDGSPRGDPVVAAIIISGVYGLFFAQILLRDAWRGRSIGKWICGVQTVLERSGRPSGVRASIQRSLPLLIPFVPLVVAYQLQKGHRLGDRWARTRVIWRRHADSPIFSESAALGRVFE